MCCSRGVLTSVSILYAQRFPIIDTSAGRSFRAIEIAVISLKPFGNPQSYLILLINSTKGHCIVADKKFLLLLLLFTCQSKLNIWIHESQSAKCFMTNEVELKAKVYV